ncbi:hypothetical protein DFH09DRAFT_1159486, partial [Mycena vulgaris]
MKFSIALLVSFVAVAAANPIVDAAARGTLVPAISSASAAAAVMRKSTIASSWNSSARGEGSTRSLRTRRARRTVCVSA